MEPATINILLVEDPAEDARRLQLLLSECPFAHYQVQHARRLAEGLARLQKDAFDLVLADLSLPDSHGFETFERLRAQAPRMPMIILSGADEETQAIRAVREGAQDYLVKERVDADILSRAIRYALERHRAEQNQQEREKHFKLLLDSIADYHYTVQLKAGHPVQSAHGSGCAAVTGYSPEDYAADPELWFRMVHPDDRKAVLAQADRVRAGEIPPPLDHRILHKSGRVRWVRNTVVPCRDQRGRLAAYDGLIADITARKLAEEKLVASEAFYHSLVENLPQNIFRKNVAEKFTFANHRFCEMLGKSLEEIIGKTDFDFFPAELASKYQQDDRHVIETGKSFETIEENVSASGEKIYVNVVKTPVYDARGQIIGIQGIFWDMTERKRWEERLQQANAELARSEAALRKSHEELKAAQMQLIQAEKMESIGTLAAGVAHEVKNPLAILLMGLNYLNKKLPNPEPNVALVLKEMREAINRADIITRGLLEYSASRQVAMRLEDLNTVIEDTLLLVRHELARTQVQVVKLWGRDLPPAGMDKNQIQQVFVNVFMNALQAMPKGGTLTIRTRARQLTESTFSEGSRQAADFWVGDTAVVAEVEDTGPGVPEAHLLKIFDPFFTTKPTGAGTGLGLAVSRKIIEVHGGRLDLRNKPVGTGVRVTVMLKAHPKDRHEKTHSAGG